MFMKKNKTEYARNSYSWWRHQMEPFSALLALCAGNSPVSGEFPTQRPATRSFDVFFDLHPNKRLNKQSRGWWFETLSCSLWRHCNGIWPLRKLGHWRVIKSHCLPGRITYSCPCLNHDVANLCQEKRSETHVTDYCNDSVLILIYSHQCTEPPLI